MKKLILLSILLFVGCSTEPEDCAGVAGGTAVEDECGVCGGGGFSQDSLYCSDLNVLHDIIDLNDSLSFITSVRWSGDGRLTLLNVNDNQISQIPPSISTLTELNHLWLGNNHITEDIFQYISSLTNLNSLYLHNNYLSGEIPDTLCNIYKDLSYFYIGNNQLCYPYPTCFSDFPENINELELVWSSREEKATLVFINVYNNSVNILGDGYIGSLQMTLQYGDNFSIEMKDENTEFHTQGNETTLIDISPSTGTLFSYSGNISISEVMITNGQIEIPFEIIYYSINDGIEYQDTTNCP